VREGRAPWCIIIDDADERVSCGHDALALRQARPRHAGARWRRVCRPPPSAASLSRRPRPARHRPCVPGLSEPSDRGVDVTLLASVWELGRSTQRERMRRRHRAVVGHLASAHGAILRRLALQVMWPTPHPPYRHVGTGHDLSAPSARRVLGGVPRRARSRPPRT
jgi:hypothetical protein